MTLPDWSASDLAIAAPVLDTWIAAYSLPADLVYGLVSQESRFKPTAFLLDRNGGSYGLMQLDLPTAQGLGYTGDGPGLYDPNTNVQLGLLYLSQLLNKYQDQGQALSAYNCGYPTGCAAGDAYAAAVQTRAFYFQDLWGTTTGAGGSFDTSGGTPSPVTFGAVVAIAAALGAVMLLLGRAR